MTRLVPTFLRALRFASTVMARPRCFMDISLDGKAAGRIVIEVSAFIVLMDLLVYGMPYYRLLFWTFLSLDAATT